MFPSSDSLARFTGPLGVPVEIHRSFVGLILIFGFIGMQGGNLMLALVQFAMLAVAIFLHELGHAWGAKVQGVPVARIVLHGGGGFCQYRSSASRTEQELIVAMGPIVNLTLWALASIGVWWLQSSLMARAAAGEQLAPGAIGGYVQAAIYLSLFARLNLMLFLFNMVPVQPLDGGKLLQLMLLRVMSPARALRVTGMVGVVACVLWIPAMIWFFVTIGFVLFFFPSLRVHLAMARGQLG